MNHKLLRKTLFLINAGIITGALASRTFGAAADHRFPKPIQTRINKMFAEAAGLDMSEADRPLEDYETLDALFTRGLKPGARDKARSPRHLISPVDGWLCAFGKVGENEHFLVKDREYSLPQLLGTDCFKDRFKDSYYCVIYLSPRNYHRIHSPIPGEVTDFSYVPGRLMPVNRLGSLMIENLLPENERMTSFIEHSETGSLVAVSKVGATCVGKISVTYHPHLTNKPNRKAIFQKLDEPSPIGHGDELGTFHLGSTVVLIIENSNFIFNPYIKPDQPVRMGEYLGEFLENA